MTKQCNFNITNARRAVSKMAEKLEELNCQLDADTYNGLYLDEFNRRGVYNPEVRNTLNKVESAEKAIADLYLALQCLENMTAHQGTIKSKLSTKL